MDLAEILNKKNLYRKEAQEAVQLAVQSFLNQHPIIEQVSWSHGDHYNDENYYFAFSNLEFKVAKPLHDLLKLHDWWRDSPYPIEDRYTEKNFKDEVEAPEAYADGKLKAALTDLKALNTKLRSLDAELVDIFSTPDEKCSFITVTRDGMEVKNRYY